MIVNGIDLIVWCIGATAEAVVCVNTSDVPVHCAVNISVFYVTFTHFMPNICSPVVRKETDNQSTVSQCFWNVRKCSSFLSCSPPSPSLHRTPYCWLLVASGNFRCHCFKSEIFLSPSVYAVLNYILHKVAVSNIKILKTLCACSLVSEHWRCSALNG